MSLSLHEQHLLFCCALAILALILLVLMALFCAASRIDSVSILRFPFLSHVHVFTCEISFVCHLKYSYSYFSFNFRFLVFVVVLFIFVLLVLFPAVVISLSFPFKCNLGVLILMDPRNLQCWRVLFLFLFLTHIDCLSHILDVRPWALSSTFFVFGSICRSFSFVHFKNSPGNLMREVTQYLFLWWDFLLPSKVLRSFLVPLRNLKFFSLFFISACLMVSDSSIPKY